MPRIPVQPVIMAGGSGTRLWPLSRDAYPKQFLVLTTDNRSLFQQAVQRLQGLADDDMELAAPLTVGNEEHRFLVLEQLREAGGDPGTVVLEPSARNTAPAMTLAALASSKLSNSPASVPTRRWLPFAGSIQRAWLSLCLSCPVSIVSIVAPPSRVA